MEKSSSKIVARVLIGAYLASFMLQAMNVMSLMLHGLSVQYPDASPQQIQLLMTVLNLFAIFGMLIAGKCASFFTKKTILVALMVIMGIGGLIGYFSTNLTMVYVAAAIIGIADGSFIPMTAALIAEFLDGSKRATAMGIQGIFVNGGAVVLNFIGGFLAATFWKNLYYIYFAALPVAIILLLVLPNGGQKEVASPGEKAPVFTKFECSFLFTFFFNGLAFMTLLSNIAMWVFEAAIGNEVQAGIIQSCTTLGSVIMGAILIVPMMKLLKRYHWAVSLTLAAIGLWILSFANSLPLATVGGFLVGSCFSMHNTAFYSIAPSNTHPAKTSISMSLGTVSQNIGMMLSPILITPIAAVFAESIGTRFLVTAVLLTIAAVVAYVLPRTVMKDCILTLDEEAKASEAAANANAGA